MEAGVRNLAIKFCAGTFSNLAGMRKAYVFVRLIVFFLFIHSSAFLYGQSKPAGLPDTVLIYPDFQETVEQHIREADVALRLPEWVYYNRLYANMYENDKLILSTKDSAAMNRYFQSFYYWQDDTLVIDGTFGLLGGYGFSLKIHKGKAQLYYLVTTDENWYCYAYTEKSRLLTRLEVPCTNTSIILSEIPGPMNQTIYGYVKFKSDPYFVNKNLGEKFFKEDVKDEDVKMEDYLDRVRARADMKIYFRSDLKPY
jgi:hypothetical protein